MRNLIFVLAVLIWTSVALSTTLSAQAQTPVKIPISIGVLPSIVQVEVAPNAISQTGKFLLKNTSQTPVNITLTMEDFVLNKNGDVKFVRTKTSSWLSLLEREITIPANQSRYVSYRTYALDSATGSQSIMVFANISCKEQIAQNEHPANKTALCVNARIGIPFLLRTPVVNGSTAQFQLSFDQLSLISAKPQTNLQLRIANSANTFFHPQGVVTMTSLWGREIAQIRILPQAVVLAKSKRIIDVVIAHPQAFGIYRLNVVIFDNFNNLQTKSKLIIRLSHSQVFVSIVIIALVFGAYLLYRRRQVSKKIT